jgi:hypothetical protein
MFREWLHEKQNEVAIVFTGVNLPIDQLFRKG